MKPLLLLIISTSNPRLSQQIVTMFSFYRGNRLIKDSKTRRNTSLCIFLQQLSLTTFDAAVTAAKPKFPRKKKGPVPFVPPVVVEPVIVKKITILADLKPSVPVAPVRKWVPKPRELTPAEKAEVKIVAYLHVPSQHYSSSSFF